MSVPTAPAASATATTTAPASRLEARAARPSWPWLRGAMLLAGAAQSITISALLSADPLAATWSALLLAIAPAPLAAVTAFAPERVGRLLAIVTGVVLVIGIVGGVKHTGLFFAPALAVLLVGTAQLWRERF